MGSILGSGLGPAPRRGVYSKTAAASAYSFKLPNDTDNARRSLTDKHPSAGLRVYARPDDSDIYLPSLLHTATLHSASETFQPTLIVLGIRLGIDRITPVYHAALRAALQTPQSVGIAGGRPSASHYFIGHQGDNSFFYLDPHSTRPALSASPSADEARSCHTRRVRRLGVEEMDPSMLIGFLIRDREDFEAWRREMVERVSAVGGKQIVHFHESEPESFSAQRPGGERKEAVDEVETWDETGEE